MHNTTSIEVKCECPIPFRKELVSYFRTLFQPKPKTMPGFPATPPQEAAIAAMESKLVFVKIAFPNPIKKISPWILNNIKRTLKKDIVGVIREGDDEVTIVLI